MCASVCVSVSVYVECVWESVCVLAPYITTTTGGPNTVDLLAPQGGSTPADVEEVAPQYVSVRVSHTLSLSSHMGNMVAGAAWGNKYVLLHSSTDDDTLATEFASGE